MEQRENTSFSRHIQNSYNFSKSRGKNVMSFSTHSKFCVISKNARVKVMLRVSARYCTVSSLRTSQGLMQTLPPILPHEETAVIKQLSEGPTARRWQMLPGNFM